MDISGFALVTGAASGLGRCCAEALAKEGAAGVALLDINSKALEETRSQIEKKKYVSATGLPCRIITHVIDITDDQQVNKVVSSVAKDFSRIDYVINSAGVTFHHTEGVAYADAKAWEKVIDINLNGTFFVLKASAQVMLKQDPILSVIDGRPLQRGSIVNFGSIYSVVGVSVSSSYTVSKHAVLGLTRTASEDHAKNGLRINAICPGYIQTPMTMETKERMENMERRIAEGVPMARPGQPQEIADGVLYLCGGRSSFVTGTSLLVDGGFTQR